MSSVTRMITDGRHIGHDVAQMMRGLRRPAAGRGDVVGIADRQRLGPGDAGIGGPGGHGDGEDGVLDPRAKRGHEGERQDQAGEGQEDVGQAHEDRVDPAAEVARDSADQQAQTGAVRPRAAMMYRVIRAPWMMRDRMSRPKSSVPSQWPGVPGG
jgi:hypothetical protein